VVSPTPQKTPLYPSRAWNGRFREYSGRRLRLPQSELHPIGNSVSGLRGDRVKLGIIGTGNMGRTLGVLWSECGHDVFFGSREPDTAKNAAHLTGDKARFGSNDEAAAFGEVLLYGIRSVPPSQVLGSSDSLIGKPLIDCNNREIPDGFEFGPMLDKSLAETLQEQAPESFVVKAFNTLSMEVFEHAPHAIRQHGVSVYISGDERSERRTVSSLVEDLGLVPVDCGNLRAARMLEATGDFIRFLMMGAGRGSYATISVRDLPPVSQPRLGGRKPSALK